MKKILLLLTVLAVVSSVGSVRTTAATHQLGTMVGRGAPEVVLNTYGQIVSDIMTVNFPANPAWEDLNVGWNKDKNEWIVSGMVNQAGGNGSGIMILSGRFENTGDMIEVLYNVIP